MMIDDSETGVCHRCCLQHLREGGAHSAIGIVILPVARTIKLSLVTNKCTKYAMMHYIPSYLDSMRPSGVGVLDGQQRVPLFVHMHQIREGRAEGGGGSKVEYILRVVGRQYY